MIYSEEELQTSISGLVLPDPEDQEISLDSYKGQVVVFYGGGRGAVDEAKKWGAAFEKKAAAHGNFVFYEIAFLGKMPPVFPKMFVKESVKGGLPILLDWDGNAEKALGLDDHNLAHIYIIDREGSLRYKMVADYGDEAFFKVFEQINKF